MANVVTPTFWLPSSAAPSFYHSFQADSAYALRRAFGVTVELQDLRFNRGCDGSELCCAQVFDSRMIRQSFVGHESHHMILENDKFL